MTIVRAAVIALVAVAAVSCSRPPQPSVQNQAEAVIANLDAEANALEMKAAADVDAAGADELANAQAAFEANEMAGNAQ